MPHIVPVSAIIEPIEGIMHVEDIFRSIYLGEECGSEQ